MIFKKTDFIFIGTLIQNDPFNCLVKIKEIGCSDVSYEKILSTSKDVNFKKHLSSSQIETKNVSIFKQKNKEFLSIKLLKLYFYTKINVLDYFNQFL